jgi:cell division septum initiation protein DivIVA
METSGSDPLAPSAISGSLPTPGFKTSRRGFDQEQVLDYLGMISTRLQTLEGQERRLRSEVEMALKQRDSALMERDALVQQRDEALRERDAAHEERISADEMTYEQVSGRVTELLVALDREVAKIRTEAETEADRIVSDARAEADRTRRETEESRNAAAYEAKLAREEAERSLADLTARRDDILSELQRTCDDFLDVIGRLADSIDVGPGEAQRAGESSGNAVVSMPEPEDRADRTVVLPDVLPDRPA